jgi:predicted membrane GTPase involved in stress response
MLMRWGQETLSLLQDLKVLMSITQYAHRISRSHFHSFLSTLRLSLCYSILMIHRLVVMMVIQSLYLFFITLPIFILGKFLTTQLLRDRLIKECETNPALQMTETGEAFEVKGRGELQMGVLIETMRREGFELSISPPRVIYRSIKSPDNQEQRAIFEPIEQVTIDCEHEQAGTVIEKMSSRKGTMNTYTEVGERARLVFNVPTRGLLGYPAEFKSDVRIAYFYIHIFFKFVLCRHRVKARSITY